MARVTAKVAKRSKGAKTASKSKAAKRSRSAKAAHTATVVEAKPDGKQWAPQARTDRKRPPRVRLEVLQADIESAMQANSRSCMIAEAIKRQVKHATRVSVDAQTIRWSDDRNGLRYVYLTPGVAMLQIYRFDYGTKVEPFNVPLDFGQVVSSHPRVNGKQVLAHKLGRKRVQLPSTSRRGRPNIIGGNAPRADASTRDRVYGMKKLVADSGAGAIVPAMVAAGV